MNSVSISRVAFPNTLEVSEVEQFDVLDGSYDLSFQCNDSSSKRGCTEVTFLSHTALQFTQASRKSGL